MGQWCEFRCDCCRNYVENCQTRICKYWYQVNWIFCSGCVENQLRKYVWCEGCEPVIAKTTWVYGKDWIQKVVEEKKTKRKVLL